MWLWPYPWCDRTIIQCNTARNVCGWSCGSAMYDVISVEYQRDADKFVAVVDKRSMT